MRKLRGLVAIVLCIATTGCYAVRVNSSARHSAKKEATLEWHFFWGLTPAQVRAIDCPNGIAEAEIKLPWWSVGCLFPLTLGIVSASKTTWTCREVPPPQLPAAP